MYLSQKRTLVSSEVKPNGVRHDQYNLTQKKTGIYSERLERIRRVPRQKRVYVDTSEAITWLYRACQYAILSRLLLLWQYSPNTFWTITYGVFNMLILLFVPKGFNTPPFRAVKKVFNPECNHIGRTTYLALQGEVFD